MAISQVSSAETVKWIYCYSPQRRQSRNDLESRTGDTKPPRVATLPAHIIIVYFIHTSFNNITLAN